LIPAREAGIRRFCLWAIGLAVLTLQKINQNPGYTAGVQVKVSRRAVAMTRILTDLAGHSDWALRRLFALAARGLPLTSIPAVRRQYAATATTTTTTTTTPTVDMEPALPRRRSSGSLVR